MGADLVFSAVPVNLSHGARDVLERAEDVSVEFACLLAYRARLEKPYVLEDLDLARAPGLSGWLDAMGSEPRGELDVVQARVLEAIDAIIVWPRDLEIFDDELGERSWLVAAEARAGVPSSGVFVELDLVAESGIWRRAVSIGEAEAALLSMACAIPPRLSTRGLAPWSARDDAAAAAEGWALTNTSRAVRLEVRHLDDRRTGALRLRDDQEAWDAVLDGVMRGSPVHARAFGALLVHAPDEAVAMVEHWAERVGGRGHQV